MCVTVRHYIVIRRCPQQSATGGCSTSNRMFVVLYEWTQMVVQPVYARTHMHVPATRSAAVFLYMGFQCMATHVIDQASMSKTGVSH